MLDQNDALKRIEPKVSGLINIIQITDTHILDDGAPTFNDFDTSGSLDRIIERIIESESDADLILLTGDLVHEPTKTSYQKLADHLSVIKTPILYLAGNHDAPEIMRYVMGPNGHDTGSIIKLDNWLIILLNSAVEGQHSGELAPEELQRLKYVLEGNPELHCLVALHHHPVPVNSKWMDAMPLMNSNAFFNVIDAFEQIRGIIWGHIHQEFESNRGDVKLYGSPSTCLQFEQGSEEFAVSDKAPAYRKLALKADGSIKSKVVYLHE